MVHMYAHIGSSLETCRLFAVYFLALKFCVLKEYLMLCL